MKITKICASIVLMSSMLLQAMSLQKNNVEIKLVDATATPDKVLFYGSSPILASKFTCAGLRPIQILIHNNGDEPIVISAQSVGEQQPDIKEIMELFQIRETVGALVVLTLCGYVTGFVNIFERKDAHARWYPLSIGCCAGSLSLAYVAWQFACDSNTLIAPMIKKHILSSRMVIPARAKRETIVLIDTSISVNRCFFDVFNLEGAVVATFDATFVEGAKV